MQPYEAMAEERVRRRPLRRVLSQAQRDEIAELRREACAAEAPTRLSISQAGRGGVVGWWRVTSRARACRELRRWVVNDGLEEHEVVGVGECRVRVLAERAPTQ